MKNAKTSKVVKTINIDKKYKFNLEIYLGFENLSWEIFPHDYETRLCMHLVTKINL